MTVTKAQHAVYDGEPVDSQLLHWSPLPFHLDTVAAQEEHRPTLIAIFKPLRSLVHLKLAAGPVTTYVHRGMSAYPSRQSPGAVEVRLDLGHGRYADIVPSGNPSNPDTASTGENVVLDISAFEIRMGKKHQLLPGYSYALNEPHALRPQEYLLWAGDLDGDGKPDLIIRHSDDGGDVAVYLSSLAKNGELVGLAGHFQFSDPASAGC